MLIIKRSLGEAVAIFDAETRRLLAEITYLGGAPGPAVFEVRQNGKTERVTAERGDLIKITNEKRELLTVLQYSHKHLLGKKIALAAFGGGKDRVRVYRRELCTAEGIRKQEQKRRQECCQDQVS